MTNTGALSVITDEISQDIKSVLPSLKQYGITHVELRNVWNKNIIDFSDEELEKLKQVLDGQDMSVCNVAGPLFKCYAPWTSKHDPRSSSYGRNVQRSRDMRERVLEICKTLECDKTRVFGYLWPVNFVKFMFSFNYPEITADQWQQLVDDIVAFVDMAKSENITVVMENEAMALVSTWESTLRILEDIQDPSFQLLLDPGNYFFCNEIHPPSTYLEIQDRVGHQHIKDGKKTLGVKHFTTVGEGLLGYDEYFDAWTGSGYNGYFSLETHVLFRKSNISYKSLANMQEMLE